MTDDPTAFTVKEMVIRVLWKLDQLDDKLELKANTSDMQDHGLKVAEQLREHGVRLTVLESDRISRKAVLAAGAGLITLVPALSLLLNMLGVY